MRNQTQRQHPEGYYALHILVQKPMGTLQEAKMCRPLRYLLYLHHLAPIEELNFCYHSLGFWPIRYSQ